MSEKAFVTVTALTKYIKRKFDVDPHLEDIWIKGELSNVKIHSRGHVYFTLKDENARMQAVMFQRSAAKLPFSPKSGMKVFVRGGIQVYEPSGNYQLYAKEMQPDGVGALHLAYEELKKKLASEGLFDARYKKQSPNIQRLLVSLRLQQERLFEMSLRPSIGAISRRKSLCFRRSFKVSMRPVPS